MLRKQSGSGASRGWITCSKAVSPLVTEIVQLSGRTCVALHGELDDASAPALRDQLTDLIDSDVTGDLILEIAALTFVDSIGLSVIVTLHKQLDANGRRLVIQSPTPMVRRLLMITGLDDILRIEPPTP